MTATIPQTTDTRAALVAGLRELADLLEAHPELYFPTSMSWSVAGTKDGDEVALQRLADWAALGFRDEWSSKTEGHHGVNVKVGALDVRFTYVENGKVRPIAWGKTPGESDRDFQKRVDEALTITPTAEAVA